MEAQPRSRPSNRFSSDMAGSRQRYRCLRSAFVVDFGLKGTAPHAIPVRNHARAHKLGDQRYNDRFNLSYILQPGRHTLRIPLKQIRNAPKDRQMDLSQIEGIVIFCSAGHAGRQFQLVEIQLEDENEKIGSNRNTGVPLFCPLN